MKILLQLFLSFALIGIGAYGGGLVAIPLIQHEIVFKQQWLSFGEMSQLLAVAQMTPGPIAINAATFVGFRFGGIIGSAVATLAVVLPSITILVLVAPLVDFASKNAHVRHLRQGLQIGVLSLILFATWSFGSGAVTGWRDLAMAAAAFAVLVAFEGKLHPVIVILASGFLGMFVL
ncbi:MAG TPA: chromate transporter [Candidatus Sumerlaeia bacterium]|nr:chromate transporter [Candidatus Sumerlaeia bacterium]